ncbi:LysR family transcriptional regulator [Achromobacter xylosoxidans]
MDRFQEMQVFVRIAERRSFAKAAEDLRIPRATVTNLIKRMEKRLGARLLERTTRQVRLTHDGEAYYRRCVRLLADLEEADGAFLNTAPKGLLRVNLQGTLARVFVMPALPAFLERCPDLVLHLGEDDRLVDLVREGVDCVLRAGTLQDSSLVGRQIALMPQVTVASPAYLARYGEPATLDDLEGHRVVDYVSSSSGRSLPLDFTVDGRNVLVRPGSVISVSGAELYTSAALAGLGLVQVPRYRVAEDLAAGRLKLVLPDAPPAPMPVSVLYPQNRQVSARVRVFSQWLAEIFGRAFGPGIALSAARAEHLGRAEPR